MSKIEFKNPQRERRHVARGKYIEEITRVLDTDLCKESDLPYEFIEKRRNYIIKVLVSYFILFDSSQVNLKDDIKSVFMIIGNVRDKFKQLELWRSLHTEWNSNSVRFNEFESHTSGIISMISNSVFAFEKCGANMSLLELKKQMKWYLPDLPPDNNGDKIEIFENLKVYLNEFIKNNIKN